MANSVGHARITTKYGTASLWSLTSRLSNDPGPLPLRRVNSGPCPAKSSWVPPLSRTTKKIETLNLSLSRSDHRTSGNIGVVGGREQRAVAFQIWHSTCKHRRANDLAIGDNDRATT